MNSRTLTHSRRLPPAVRLLLGAAGLFCAIMPAWEFRHALLEPSILTVFFGIIIVGGWAVGGAFLMGALFGEAQVWRFGSGQMYVARRSVFLDTTDTVSGREVKSVEVDETVWDGRAPTFSVIIRTKSGKSYGSGEHDTREKAEALAALVRERLRL